MKYWYILATCMNFEKCMLSERSHTKGHILFQLYEMSRRSKSIQTGVDQWLPSAKYGASASWVQGFFLG